MDFVLPHLLFLLILLPIFSIAQNNGNITTGNFLTATNNSSPWLSPSGDFAFGFHPLNQTDLFLLSIWFAKVPEKTIVWFAKERLDTIPAPRGSKVELTADHGLVLTGPQGDPLWNTSSNIIGTVANGFMSNTGNFELHDRNFNKLWESFKNPSDTLLPSQNMDIGGVLSSRQSETHFSIGRFQLRLIPGGNLVLNTINLPTVNPSNPYYTSGTSQPSNPGKQLVLNQSGYIYILTDNNQTLPLRQGKPESAAEFYFRATLNFDGVFTLYSYPKNSNANGIWTPIWSVPDNICVASSALSDSGTCGFNSICTLGSDKRPICRCPKGYSLLDPNDPYGSCKPDFIQGCEEDKLNPRKDLYYFEVLTNTYFINSENYAILKPYSEDQCSKSCMDDCMCVVAVFKDGDTCYKKKLPLSNGRVDNSNIGGKAYMKIRKITQLHFRIIVCQFRKQRRRIMTISSSCGQRFLLALCLSTLY